MGRRAEVGNRTAGIRKEEIGKEKRLAVLYLEFQYLKLVVKEKQGRAFHQ
jgi:hypothetical protein